jgi:hypothetical protein
MEWNVIMRNVMEWNGMECRRMKKSNPKKIEMVF